MIKKLFALALFAAVASTGFVVTADPAAAQATCRDKCNDEEQACLKRTGNKGQCGNTAQSCAAKCK